MLLFLIRYRFRSPGTAYLSFSNSEVRTQSPPCARLSGGTDTVACPVLLYQVSMRRTLLPRNQSILYVVRSVQIPLTMWVLLVLSQGIILSNIFLPLVLFLHTAVSGISVCTEYGDENYVQV
jgi:hypothetical protein